MKVLKYNMKRKINMGTSAHPVWEYSKGTAVTLSYQSEESMRVAQAEAYHGEIIVSDDEMSEAP